MGRFEDLTGRVFGRLTVLRIFDKQHDRHRWLCRCSCGSGVDKPVYANILKGGGTLSCGCLARENGRIMAAANRKAIPLIALGTIVGSYIVVTNNDRLSIERDPAQHIRCLIRCECGHERSTRASSIRSGRDGRTLRCSTCARGRAKARERTRSRERVITQRLKEGLTATTDRRSSIVRRDAVSKQKSRHRHALADRPSLTYVTWQAMKTRCLNPKADNYAAYGGAGITVCARWLVFENFLADMGERPSRAYSIDRFPNNAGNYEPDNCRWATASQQRRNQRPKGSAVAAPVVSTP